MIGAYKFEQAYLQYSHSLQASFSPKGQCLMIGKTEVCHRNIIPNSHPRFRPHVHILKSSRHRLHTSVGWYTIPTLAAWMSSRWESREAKVVFMRVMSGILKYSTHTLVRTFRALDAKISQLTKCPQQHKQSAGS